jgi:hypothetical protein
MVMVAVIWFQVQQMLWLRRLTFKASRLANRYAVGFEVKIPQGMSIAGESRRNKNL